MKRTFFITTLMTCLFVFIGCDDNDDLTHPGNNKDVENTFETMYPDASLIEWERKGNYWVVEFHKDTKEMEAWFELTGEWYQTETDILFTTLPETIKTSFQSGGYNDWYVEDVDMFERKDTDTFYILDVEKSNQDYDLYYSSDGTLIKAIADPS